MKSHHVKERYTGQLLAIEKQTAASWPDDEGSRKLKIAGS